MDSKTIRKQVIDAIANNDCDSLGRVVDHLRNEIGMNYNDAYDYVSKIRAISLADYDQMLRIADDNGVDR